jgi:Vitamin B12 dependent methionine synthase, activation domain
MMENVFSQRECGKDTFEVAINFTDLIIHKNEIISTLGYADGAIPAHFEEMIDDILSQVPAYSEIQAGYRILDVATPDDRNDGLLVGGKFFKLQKIVTGQLRKSEKAALFICTIGKAMETYAKKLYVEGDVTRSYLVDTIASVIAEQTTDALHDHIKVRMQIHGLKITNRYSPGYCDWSVAEQHLLFSFFPENFCGMTLTESAFMVPIKSVSGIIGIGTSVKNVDYTCGSCGVKDCTYRANRAARSERVMWK